MPTTEENGEHFSSCLMSWRNNFPHLSMLRFATFVLIVRFSLICLSFCAFLFVHAENVCVLCHILCHWASFCFFSLLYIVYKFLAEIHISQQLVSRIKKCFLYLLYKEVLVSVLYKMSDQCTDSRSFLLLNTAWVKLDFKLAGIILQPVGLTSCSRC